MAALPRPRRIANDVWAIAAPIPDGPPYTLSYVLRGPDGLHIIDAGWDSDSNRDSLISSLELLGESVDNIRTVFATHHHPDHLGLATHLRETVGARVVLGRVERAVLAEVVSPGYRDPGDYATALASWSVPLDRRPELVEAMIDSRTMIVDIEPDQLLDDGETIDLGGHRLTTVATPGHTDGHLCLVDLERRLLYTGDHVLPRINPGIGLGTLGDREPLEDMLDSLDALAPYDGFLVLPGHDEPFDDLAARRVALMRHHLRRTREVLDLLPDLGDSPVWDYASRLTWTAGFESLRGFFLHSALSQTERHLRLARSGRAEPRLRAAGLG